MALEKEITTKHGFTANYWRVDSITTDKPTKTGSFVIGVYKDAEAAQIAEESIECRYVNFFMDLPYNLSEEERKQIGDERYEKYFALGKDYDDQYAACYAMAREIDPFFADAVDC